MADEVKVDVKDESTNGTNAGTEKKTVDDVKEDLGPPNTLEKKIIRQLEVFLLINIVNKQLQKVV